MFVHFCPVAFVAKLGRGGASAVELFDRGISYTCHILLRTEQ